MLRPDENANELRRRISNQPFSIRVDPRNTEVIKVGEIVEMQTIPSDIQEVCMHKTFGLAISSYFCYSNL